MALADALGSDRLGTLCDQLDLEWAIRIALEQIRDDQSNPALQRFNRRRFSYKTNIASCDGDPHLRFLVPSGVDDNFHKSTPLSA